MEGDVIVDDNLDLDSDGSESEIEPVAQKEKEENADAEYTNIKRFLKNGHFTRG